MGKRLAGLQILPPLIEMRLDHHAEDAILSRSQLGGDIGGHVFLATIVLVAVAMRKVDHHTRGKA